MSDNINTADHRSEARIITLISAAATPGNRTLTFDHDIIILSLLVQYITSAVAGNRQFRLRVEDTITGIAQFRETVDINQAASSGFFYNFFPGVQRDTAAINSALNVPFPPEFFLSRTSSLLWDDRNGVDVANDQSAYSINYIEY